MFPLRNSFLCRVALLIISLTITVTSATAQAPRTIPSTARGAAASPQFAGRLARPVPAQHSTKPQHRTSSCGRTQRGGDRGVSLSDYGIVYENGPTNGEVDAWTINYGYAVADTFTVPAGGASVTGFSFAVWLFPGDTVGSVEVSITSSAFGGTSYYDAAVNFSAGSCAINDFGFNVCTETGYFAGPNLNPGTYWVDLQNAVVTSDEPAYWDENSGPSQADQNQLGSIPSESFTILGNTTTTTTYPTEHCMPEQDGNFSVLHDFTGSGDGSSPSGVAVDTVGNLYGATGGNGPVYKLAQTGMGWVLSTLYNFVGGANGSSPSNVIVGQHGILYGAASGGIDNCPSGGFCGFVFALRPKPNACQSTSCDWIENPVYSFTGPTDAWNGGNLVADGSGNLYGVSYSGGAQQAGAVFELSRSIGGWIESIVYSFSGGGNGGGPNDIIVGNDGNLYGTTTWGGTMGGGVVFQLTRSSGGWTETVLYNMPTNDMGMAPNWLTQDRAGNLYGVYHYSTCCADTYGLIYMLSPSNGSWVFTVLHHGDESADLDLYQNMVMDSQGNLFGTESAHYGGCMGGSDDDAIFEMSQGTDGWQYDMPVGWGYTYFPSSGRLAVDANDNLYGTTNYCGSHDNGSVWQFITR